MFKKILIANRGEIAIRIMRSAQELGIPAVAIYEETDKTGMHIMKADEAICIGSGPRKDYLNIDRIIQAGADTFSFGDALRSALRQVPDVILVGEMRDFETISIALTAAETGHLVLSTLHTVDTTETINRIISVFPPYQQKQVRMQLAAVIKGIVSQWRLVARADGKGRVPACEVMLGTLSIRESIIDDAKTRNIPTIISQGLVHYGMQTFDQSLLGLYKKTLITYEEALLPASNPHDFAPKVKGIQSTSDISMEEDEKKNGLRRRLERN